MDCVQECLQSLSEEDLTLEDAFDLQNEMPEELWEHEAAMGIRSNIIKVLGEKLDEVANLSKEGGVEAAEIAAATVMTSKVVKALVWKARIDSRLAKEAGAVTGGQGIGQGPGASGQAVREKRDQTWLSYPLGRRFLQAPPPPSRHPGNFRLSDGGFARV